MAENRRRTSSESGSASKTPTINIVAASASAPAAAAASAAAAAAPAAASAASAAITPPPSSSDRMPTPPPTSRYSLNIVNGDNILRWMVEYDMNNNIRTESTEFKYYHVIAYELIFSFFDNIHDFTGGGRASIELDVIRLAHLTSIENYWKSISEATSETPPKYYTFWYGDAPYQSRIMKETLDEVKKVIERHVTQNPDDKLAILYTRPDISNIQGLFGNFGEILNNNSNIKLLINNLSSPTLQQATQLETSKSIIGKLFGAVLKLPCIKSSSTEPIQDRYNSVNKYFNSDSFIFDAWTGNIVSAFLMPPKGSKAFMIYDSTYEYDPGSGWCNGVSDIRSKCTNTNAVKLNNDELKASDIGEVIGLIAPITSNQCNKNQPNPNGYNDISITLSNFDDKYTITDSDNTKFMKLTGGNVSSNNNKITVNRTDIDNSVSRLADLIKSGDLSLKKTYMDLKRIGDWFQIESAKQRDAILITNDRICAMWAFFRGVNVILREKDGFRSIKCIKEEKVADKAERERVKKAFEDNEILLVRTSINTFQVKFNENKNSIQGYLIELINSLTSYNNVFKFCKAFINVCIKCIVSLSSTLNDNILTLDINKLKEIQNKINELSSIINFDGGQVFKYPYLFKDESGGNLLLYKLYYQAINVRASLKQLRNNENISKALVLGFTRDIPNVNFVYLTVLLNIYENLLEKLISLCKTFNINTQVAAAAAAADEQAIDLNKIELPSKIINRKLDEGLIKIFEELDDGSIIITDIGKKYHAGYYIGLIATGNSFINEEIMYLKHNNRSSLVDASGNVNKYSEAFDYIIDENVMSLVDIQSPPIVVGGGDNNPKPLGDAMYRMAYYDSQARRIRSISHQQSENTKVSSDDNSGSQGDSDIKGDSDSEDDINYDYNIISLINQIDDIYVIQKNQDDNIIFVILCLILKDIEDAINIFCQIKYYYNFHSNDNYSIFIDREIVGDLNKIRPELNAELAIYKPIYKAIYEPIYKKLMKKKFRKNAFNNYLEKKINGVLEKKQKKFKDLIIYTKHEIRNQFKSFLPDISSSSANAYPQLQASNMPDSQATVPYSDSQATVPYSDASTVLGYEQDFDISSQNSSQFQIDDSFLTYPAVNELINNNRNIFSILERMNIYRIQEGGKPKPKKIRLSYRKRRSQRHRRSQRRRSKTRKYLRIRV